MQVERADAEARAIDWLVRQRDPDFTDWDVFADWLAEDEAHAAIYDAVASLDRDLDALPPSPAPSVVVIPDTPRRPSRRAWLGCAMAAAVVGMIGVSGLGLFDCADRIWTILGEHHPVTHPGGWKLTRTGVTGVS